MGDCGVGKQSDDLYERVVGFHVREEIRCELSRARLALLQSDHVDEFNGRMNGTSWGEEAREVLKTPIRNLHNCMVCFRRCNDGRVKVCFRYRLKQS